MQLSTQIYKHWKSVVSFWRSSSDTIVRFPQYFPWQHFWKIIISNYLICLKVILKIGRFLGISLLKIFKQMQAITCYSKIRVHICFISTCNNNFCYYLSGADRGYVKSVNWRTFHSTDTTICVYKMLQTSAHSETVIINIEGSIIPSVKFKVVSQLKTHPRKLVRT